MCWPVWTCISNRLLQCLNPDGREYLVVGIYGDIRAVEKLPTKAIPGDQGRVRCVSVYLNVGFNILFVHFGVYDILLHKTSF